MGESIKLIANNKKAYHDYFIEDNYEAGISLHGTEVKSLRMGKCSIKESFIRIENGEVIIYGMQFIFFAAAVILQKLLALGALEFGMIILVFILMTFSPVLIDVITAWIHTLYVKLEEREEREERGFLSLLFEKIQK